MQEQTKRYGSIRQPDFIMIPTQLLSDNSLQPLDRILFGYIYWMTKLALMKCVAGNITLAQLTHASQRGVANSLTRLEKKGYISRIYQDESNRVRVEILCLVAFNTQVTSTEDTLHQMMKPLHETMKHVTSNDEQNKNNRIRIYKKNSNTTNVVLPAAPQKIDLVSKVYHEAVKSLQLPVLNHDTLMRKIAAMKNEVPEPELLVYLEFMRDKFNHLSIPYKPDVNSALDIYSKRMQITNVFKRAAEDKKANVVRIKTL